MLGRLGISIVIVEEIKQFLNKNGYKANFKDYEILSKLLSEFLDGYPHLSIHVIQDRNELVFYSNPEEVLIVRIPISKSKIGSFRDIRSGILKEIMKQQQSAILN